jgi:hypothetical protein
MSAPNLSISVEPVQNGKATYLPLVAPTSNDTPKGKIVLRLDIKNNGTSPVTITGIAYGFPGSQVAPVMMQGVDQFFSAYYKDSGGPVLFPGQSKTWTNGLINLVPDDPNSQVNNAIFLPEPIPSNIEARVSCAGFSQPATVALSLVPHKSTTPQGSYFFPYHADDLRFAEYCVGSAGALGERRGVRHANFCARFRLRRLRHGEADVVAHLTRQERISEPRLPHLRQADPRPRGRHGVGLARWYGRKRGSKAVPEANAFALDRELGNHLVQ